MLRRIVTLAVGGIGCGVAVAMGANSAIAETGTPQPPPGRVAAGFSVFGSSDTGSSGHPEIPGLPSLPGVHKDPAPPGIYFNQYFLGGLDAARVTRDVDPSVPVVWGGVHPSLVPDSTLRHDLVDAIVVGEGDRSLPALANALFAATGKRDLTATVLARRSAQRPVPAVTPSHPGTLVVTTPANVSMGLVRDVTYTSVPGAS